MIPWVLRRATGRNLIIAVVVFALGSAAIFGLGPYTAVRDAAGGRALPEEGITPPAELDAYLSALGSDGRELYRQFQRWDIANPVLLAMLGLALVGWLLHQTGLAESRWRGALLLALVAPAADLLENVVIGASLSAYPQTAGVAGLLPALSTIKFAGLALTFVLVLVLAVRLARIRLSV